MNPVLNLPNHMEEAFSAEKKVAFNPLEHSGYL